MPFRLLVSVGLLCALLPLHHGAPGPDGTAPDPAHYRERVKAMFYHAYDSYLENAFPYDELRPLTCDGHDTWGSFSLTLIDALDTLLILGNVTEFQRVVEVLQDNVDFDIDVNASVFETNIRVVGGLLSAHLLSKKAGVEVEAGWPCSGPLLRMAEEAARKLLPEYNKAIRNYTRFDDWYLWVQMYKGTVSMPVFQSLEAYWPGLQSLIGDIDNAMRTFLNYYTVWKQFGGLPEFYNIPQGYTVEKREGYPLRPELIESAMYLYRATGDPTLLELGRDAVESIEKISKVECGFATFTESFLTERDKQSKWSGIPQLLLKLYATSHLHSDFVECQNILKEISPLLSMEAMAFVTEERKLTQETTYPNTYIFDLFGGVDLLVEILMRPTISIRSQKLKISDEMSKDCLSILYNTCVCTEGVTKRLAEKNDFVIFLFTLMTSKKTFLQTATLIEDILGVKKEMIRLDEVPNLSSLVSNFDQQQLANFCRILAVTISEMDTGNDDKHTLLAKNAQQKKSLSLGPSAAEINQAALLSIPGFVERLCKLATRKVSESTGTASFLQELEEWYTWLDNALVLDALMRVANEESEHNQASIVFHPPGASEENGLPHTSTRTQLPQSMKIMHEIMYKLEVLYVLCVLLMGRQRNQVHRMIAEFKLIPGLNNLFDKLIWRKHSASTLVLHGHNQNCDCSPDITLKIQFLRLLQSFSDHHENKYLLLNNQELNELSAISLKANIPEVEAVLNTDRSLVCDGKRGLLTRLLQVMKKEPAESSFRFWQARAVESFLRGTTSYADQMFLLKRGLLEHILYCIVDSECKSRDVLQSYFDLLGELMKFNVDAFKRFNKYINTDAKFQVFLKQINSSLVDSNMLVRCVTLSLDRFENQVDMKVAEVLSECRLLAYISQVPTQMSFLFRLINIIHVQTLTQENVSCLNTSLVILMLARRKERLPLYLRLLQRMEHSKKYPGFLLNNFHNLLRFWQQHYLHKDKDSTCLENSSCISFSYWKETVSILLNPDRQSPSALVSYIEEPYMDIDRDFTEE
ncbi:short transient receptor potential channel 4-associated protein isoform X2 [Talpa occidentalis]|uniref:short transient receptor potential channel 4-associated protein isoform X2 n=1 Tax=Talpa occidentalis TaxID=50954 RepID=UPI0023F6199A|nr:short transient receptor potential channel 4-associated protein isoform X2 [Talpa occidentalis]